MKKRINITYLLQFFILLIASLYLGLLVSLHFIWYPEWKNITALNIDAMFNKPVIRAVAIFKPLVIALLCFSTLLIFLNKDRVKKMLSGIQLIMVIVFAFISVRYVLPLNEELKKITNDSQLRESLFKWMKYNDYRMYLIVCIWLMAVIILSRSDSRF